MLSVNYMQQNGVIFFLFNVGPIHLVHRDFHFFFFSSMGAWKTFPTFCFLLLFQSPYLLGLSKHSWLLICVRKHKLNHAGKELLSFNDFVFGITLFWMNVKLLPARLCDVKVCLGIFYSSIFYIDLRKFIALVTSVSKFVLSRVHSSCITRFCCLLCFSSIFSSFQIPLSPSKSLSFSKLKP